MQSENKFKADIALIGLAVMGENLVLNLESNGFRVSVYNRTPRVTESFITGRAAGKNIEGHKELVSFIGSLEVPRKIIMMVKAGDAVDSLIESLIPLLSPGDILIDGGNSNHLDTDRRLKYLKKNNIHYVGAGIFE